MLVGVVCMNCFKLYYIMSVFVVFIVCSGGSTLFVFFFFFKQKTAYEIGTGDWSSDVCSSDLYKKQGAAFNKKRAV